MSISRYAVIDDFPVRIPVFPLDGVILFPRRRLPLNIFEPRYLKMVDDAMSGNRLIGMIQPTTGSADNLSPDFMNVGAVGRITGYEETEDNRYMIILTGVSRFHITEEVDVDTPYRQVEADYSAFTEDLVPLSAEYELDRDRLALALRKFVETKGLQLDPEITKSVPPEALVNDLSSLCPFAPIEKQSLLEAKTLADRFESLTSLLELYSISDDAGEFGLQ